MNKFIGPSYTLNARKADVQRAVNLMPVTVEVPGGKSVAYLDSVPGVAIFSNYTSEDGYLLTEMNGLMLNEDGTKIGLN